MPNSRSVKSILLVTKASGKEVPFDPEKLRLSLQKAGASENVIHQIIAETGGLLYPGISTTKIYQKAFAMLNKDSTPVAARYKLKKAIRELGPTGFPFEKYVAEILKHEGYKVAVGQMVQGHCIAHEVDVIAQKDKQHFMIECKFHSKPGNNCNVKVPLYIQSRFLDVKKRWEKKTGHGTFFHQGWVVTNTRFSGDAIQYGSCVGLNLVSWDYPSKGSLMDRITLSGLHPITCLTSLTKSEKQCLLEIGVILCKDLCENPEWLQKANVNARKRKRILDEATEVCKSLIIS